MYYCNSNDLPVKKACEQLEVNCTGILGVLGRVYKKGKLTSNELESLLQKLLTDETTCYIKEDLIISFREEMY